jgi:prepilin-type N-terminal cleavage/methylation domain-containing protein
MHLQPEGGALPTIINSKAKGTNHMFDRYRMIQQERAEGSQGGFTLIELLIVIVVLGILAAVTVFALGGVTQQSLTSACQADAKSVVIAQEAWRAQNSSPVYAANVGVLVPAYLRTAPGNTGRYIITTDNTGAVFVKQTLATAAPYNAATNFETTPAVCLAIP